MPDDADIAAGRDRLHAVLGLPPADRPQPRPEAQEVLGDLHPAPLGGDEVAELVQHDHRHQGEHDEQHRPGVEHDREQRCRRPRPRAAAAAARARRPARSARAARRRRRRRPSGQVSRFAELVASSCAAAGELSTTLSASHAGERVGREDVLDLQQLGRLVGLRASRRRPRRSPARRGARPGRPPRRPRWRRSATPGALPPARPAS